MPSRFAVKVFANGFFAVIAIAVFISFVAVDRRDNALNAIRHLWVTDYMQTRKDEAKAALVQERETGSADTLIRLLELPSWKEMRLSDRAYRLKRKMLSRLCINLQQQRDYQRLIKWANIWLSINDRNLDARAFWFEGIRHVPGRETEGLEGLIANYHDFPENYYLHSFLVATYHDQGDTDAANRIIMEKARSVASDVVSRWQIFWTTSEYDVFSKDRSEHLALQPGEGTETILQFELPADATAIRVDPPTKSHLRIRNLQTSLGGSRREISSKDIKLSKMRREGDSLLAYGIGDPYFIFPVETVGDADGNTRLKVILHLQISLIVAGYDVAVIDFLEKQ
ncbi:MAG: hypothetical protein QF732_09730 [Nitrospinaceae bacterium]|jgi:hypothetical protein|nr:hypothetical protein [Nitrospinaceae bacterium]